MSTPCGPGISIAADNHRAILRRASYSGFTRKAPITKPRTCGWLLSGRSRSFRNFRSAGKSSPRFVRDTTDRSALLITRHRRIETNRRRVEGWHQTIRPRKFGRLQGKLSAHCWWGLIDRREEIQIRRQGASGWGVEGLKRMVAALSKRRTK